jgi:ACS family hexuronate transporter-like MFS transporter
MPARKFKNYRWIIVVLLFFATTINYLDRQIIGLLKPILEKEFAWTETDFAHIVMAFTAAYAVGLISFGWLIDKIGTKLGYAITIVVWSIAGMLHALARSAFGFGVARVGLGLGEAGNYPAAMKTVAEWFPKKERALATGFFNAGTSIGVVVALLVVPLILNYYGWQEVFWITGSFGFIWLIFWWIFYEVPSKQKRLSAEELAFIKSGQDVEGDKTNATVAVKWQKLFLFPQTLAMITGKGLIDPIYWFFLFWLPSFFSTTFSLDLKRPSLQLMVILAQFAKEAWVAVALISLAVAAHQAWATNVFTMASDMFPTEAVSSVVGIAGMAGAIGGILFPILIGSLLDSYKAAGNLAGGYHLIFTLCGFTYLFAWIIIHLLTRKSEKVELTDLY